ncbi:phosphoglucomutase [Drosophila grimshawi]|uniref:phosphoglucomutase (alpha-D-glucose-1,6-bisphosphate-dependent) n=1 Tax=Drosophila grimshawi TaxID=7222 RepID=B4IZY5_DROGR|nr:phosphoglucomutase [Drosophila grimshawi]EDV96757.1 GH15036 [Drosophila grimshawi]
MSQGGKVEIVQTTPYEGQKPGTSGLRKKVKVFTQPNYTENFVQCTLDANGAALDGSTLVVGGDGRFYCKEAAELIVRIAAANGVSKLLVGQNGILSTPAVSSLIRHNKALGGIVLTASHNPGGPENDFGIKFNTENGGPAPDAFTNHIHKLSTEIKSYKLVRGLQIDIGKVGETSYTVDGKPFVVEVIDSVANYVRHMEQIFDFGKLRDFVSGKSNGKPLKMRIDSMNGVTGAYVREIFLNRLGAAEASVVHTTPLPDFGGLHPDPNLTYAKDLVDTVAKGDYDIGAAFDGDGDRNMIIGSKAFFVTPSDSLAVIAHYLEVIPYFQKNGVHGFARSMPTASAVDLVGKKLGKEVFEVPTGWKYFGNLMDVGRLCLCGEESFGTGSDHIREKDGIWAVLAWISVMQHTGKSIEDILKQHWSVYGRNYFTRYDYEECDLEPCNEMMATMEKNITAADFAGKSFSSGGKTYKVKQADNFNYTDPVDKSVATKQGLRIVFEDGSRIVMRLSGTGSSGATVRLYIDSYEKENVLGQASVMLKPLIDIALEISQLPKFTGRTAPTVIT